MSNKNVYFMILIFFSCLLINNCAKDVTKFEREYDIYGVDFCEHSKKNFLFTPYSYDGKYRSDGLVRFRVVVGAHRED